MTHPKLIITILLVKDLYNFVYHLTNKQKQKKTTKKKYKWVTNLYML